MSEENRIRAGRLFNKNRKLVLEFRKENPETIGETDTTFDYGNYIDFLEKELIEVRAQANEPEEAVGLLNDLIMQNDTLWMSGHLESSLSQIKSLLGGAK